jgi:hypothetical protein
MKKLLLFLLTIAAGCSAGPKVETARDGHQYRLVRPATGGPGKVGDAALYERVGAPGKTYIRTLSGDFTGAL